MKINILPKTTLGKWSLGTILAGILLYVVFFMVVRMGFRSGVHVPASPTILIFISAIASMVLGIISVFKSKERSILIFITISIGFLALVFLVGDAVDSLLTSA
jgi:hypothetical protein